jgi:uncharacterized protein (DUF302 family)
MLDSGLVTIKSPFGVKETIDRLVKQLVPMSMQMFARIDHAAGAVAAGMNLRPTELLVFGNAKRGTPLMQEHQTCGIDLPSKFLAWEDEDKQVWLTYNDPIWIADRHSLSEQSREPSEILAVAIKRLLAAAEISKN